MNPKIQAYTDARMRLQSIEMTVGKFDQMQRIDKIVKDRHGDILEKAVDAEREAREGVFSEIERLEAEVGRLQAKEVKTGIAAIIGQWPGDESDEEINRALEELS